MLNAINKDGTTVEHSFGGITCCVPPDPTNNSLNRPLRTHVICPSTQWRFPDAGAWSHTADGTLPFRVRQLLGGCPTPTHFPGFPRVQKGVCHQTVFLLAMTRRLVEKTGVGVDVSAAHMLFHAYSVQYEQNGSAMIRVARSSVAD
jgi:hypothetical protein